MVVTVPEFLPDHAGAESADKSTYGVLFASAKPLAMVSQSLLKNFWMYKNLFLCCGFASYPTYNASIYNHKRV